jgi:RNA polymerase sigma-70 factor (ECF subfamily)
VNVPNWKPDDSDPIVHAICAAKAGDPDGIRRFLEAVEPWVARTCRGVLGAGHPDVDDAVQECLLAAVKALGKYRFQGDVRHFVGKIALRMAIAIKRRSTARWRHQQRLGAEPTLEALPMVSLEWSSDEIELVRRVFDQLSSEQSEAVFLRVMMGYSVEEIARMTKASTNTVKSRLRLGKDAVRKAARKSRLWRRWFSKEGT